MEINIEILEKLTKRILEICKNRNWRLDPISRGGYLHLEASEFIESLRGKGKSDPAEEAADVLIVWLSICAAHKVSMKSIFEYLELKLQYLES